MIKEKMVHGINAINAILVIKAMIAVNGNGVTKYGEKKIIHFFRIPGHSAEILDMQVAA